MITSELYILIGTLLMGVSAIVSPESRPIVVDSAHMLILIAIWVKLYEK